MSDIRVLVLDDTQGVRDLLEIALKGSHVEIKSTPDPLEAIRYHADVYILDHNLNAELDGDDVARILNETYDDVYLISHSSRNPENAPANLYNMIVQKPTGLKILQRLVEDIQ